MKKSSAQSLVEALFVVVFTTIIMFSFLQICIMVVDDMTANEAAFSAMRSAAVTKNDKRQEEAENRIKNYYGKYYLLGKYLGFNEDITGSFGFSTKEEVAPFYNRRESNNESSQNEQSSEVSDNFVTVWPKYPSQVKHTESFSGEFISKQTVKLYYYTKVMFGSLTAPKTSKPGSFFEKYILKRTGRRRYQSARCRMVPSPDSEFYYKAYPGANNFD